MSDSVATESAKIKAILPWFGGSDRHGVEGKLVSKAAG